MIQTTKTAGEVRRMATDLETDRVTGCPSDWTSADEKAVRAVLSRRRRAYRNEEARMGRLLRGGIR